VEAEGQAEGSLSFTWLEGQRYYTITAAAEPGTMVYLTRIGANDPEFNLRPEPALILRKQAGNHVFASAIEPHGLFDGDREYTCGSDSMIRNVSVIAAAEEGTVVRITGEGKLDWTLMIANDPGVGIQHTVHANHESYTWTGNAKLLKK
jgi:hypothetical protein